MKRSIILTLLLLVASLASFATVGPILGPLSVCTGSSVILTDTTGGGSWISSNPGVASVSPTGVVLGVSSGTAVITYAVSGTSGGGIVTAVFTVNPLPTPIVGISMLCNGTTTTYSSAPPGGTWSTSSIALTIGSGTGIATAVLTGVASITYTLPTGCAASKTVTVTTSAPLISGTPTVCVGSTTALTDAGTGGTWSSSTPAIATVEPASGLVHGVGTGTSIITYTLTAGCAATRTVTVTPAIPTISGLSTVAVGSTITLTDGIPSGTWSSSSTVIASVSIAGIVTGNSAGVAIITYSVGGCTTTKSVTVTAASTSTITGPGSLCVGSTGTYTTDDSSAGNWYSSHPVFATIDSISGLVTAVSAGTTTISYISGSGITTLVITINPLPAVIGGSSTICLGSFMTMTDPTPGGTWSSSNIHIDSIEITSGILWGVAVGSAVITYTLPTGCFVTKVVTVGSGSSPITGPSVVCLGSTITLSDVTTGGSWTSSNPAVASVGATSGVVTGISFGTAIITYSTGGCIVTKVISVTNAGGVSGPSTACIGSATSYFSDSSGTWSSSNPLIATIGATSGILTGMTSGVVTITFTHSGCITTEVVTVTSAPAVIGGGSTVCSGSTLVLTDATLGGSWSSSTPFVATIDPFTGVVTGVAPGTTTISYTVGSGCTVTKVITVSSGPGPIAGPSTVCLGGTITLTDPAPGGAWITSNILIAPVSSSGVVTGSGVGAVVITYSLGGCKVTKSVTVVTTPVAISGGSTLCAGSSITLSDATAGGSWSTSNAAVATVDASGVVTGVAGGTANISYTNACGHVTKTVTVSAAPIIGGIPITCNGNSVVATGSPAGGTWSTTSSSVSVDASTGTVTGLVPGTGVITYTLASGCFATETITVNAIVSPTGATTTVAVGSTILLTDAMPGGIWISTDPSIATINSAGVVTGVAPGLVTILYNYGPCAAGIQVTVTPAVVTPPISGPSAVCQGANVTYTESVGGTWSSSNGLVAIIGATSGILTPLLPGTTTLTFVPTTGSPVTMIVTVNPIPTSLSASNVCVGTTSVASTTSVGGTWISSNPSVATVGSASGVVSGISLGVVGISYVYVSTGCASVIPVTVNANPAAITGITTICSGSTSTLADATPGGTWSSTNTAVAIVNPLTGVVTGTGFGVATINYTLSTTCAASITVTVTPAPSPISGPSTVCVGSSIGLGDATSGGTWSSSSANVTVGLGTGLVTGVAPGIAIITYSIGSGCSVTKTLTVTPGPGAIGGSPVVCLGGTTTLTNTTPGGTWSSSNLAIAPVNSAGVVTGIGLGTTTISYSVGGCVATVTVTVSGTPSPISGPSTLCVGATATLTDAVTGGTWSSSNTAIVTVSSAGVITGIGAGAAAITYVTPCGGVFFFLTVNPAPAAISGPSVVCVGSTITLNDIPSGGTWSSSAPTTASIGLATGIVTGISFGSATITYKLPSGCFVTKVISVSAGAPPIVGTNHPCVGVPVTYLNDSIGAWSSSNPGVGVIGATSGVFNGISAGITTITFTSGSGCKSTLTVTVNPSPGAISGPTSVCIGNTIVVTDVTPGGIWSSSNVTVATINSAGVVTGISAGVTTITYALSSGCYATMAVTVTPGPAPITGPIGMCVGGTTTLSDAVGGGTWSSGTPAVATVNSATGVVTGVSFGSSVITYSVGGCIATTIVTVGSTSAISGPNTVCAGSTITLTDGASGGSWSSSNVSVATVNAAGLVTGIAPGVAIISYATTSGCLDTKTVTVTPAPAAIGGPSGVCVGSTITLTDAVTGGTWSSTPSFVASINSVTGVVTGISSGTAIVTYTVGGCSVTKAITVSAGSPILGPGSVCIGSTITLVDSIPGGSWSSGTPGVATVGITSGVVTGVSFGVTVITYSTGGCIATKTLTVNPLPAPITGSSTLCAGSTTALSDATPGGVWSSSTPAVATINSAGVVTGVAPGITTITYTAAGSGCMVTKTMTVTAGPAAIIGSSTVCVGSTITLSDAVAGGTWSSGSPAVATINPITGVVMGIANGTTVITYSVGGCSVTKVIAVGAVAPILGPNMVCVGSTISLVDSFPGGVWISSNSPVAWVDSLTGVVHGNSTGVATISYVVGGCIATMTVTVNPGPAAITGSSTLCHGTTTVFTDATPGGIWSTTNFSIATVNTAGVVTGVGTGVVTIKYTLPSGCSASKTITVNAAPVPISGPSGGCVGSTIALSDSVGGGIWSSSNTAIATVGSTSGIVTGTHAGVVTITYSVGGCSVTKTLTISVAPATIVGSSPLCAGTTTTFTDATPGGTWMSSNTAVATVSSAGVVMAISSGVVNIYYSTGGCSVAKTVTVNAAPFPISGSSTACIGTTITLTDSIPGGVWTTSSPSVAAVGATTGIVTGLSSGVAIIYYSIGSCSVSKTVTVSASPAAITGGSSVCVGTTITLADATTGGVWSSGSAAIATVNTAGTVTGVSAGMVNISYTKGGCSVHKTVSVNNAPGPIAGPTSVCAGATITLTDPTAGGTWISSNALVATVNTSTGVATGVTPGFIVAYYTVGGCSVYRTLTVNPSPKAITGASSLCSSASITLADLTPGGIWISSNIVIATVSPTGVVNGVSAGLVNISYLVAGCSSTKALTVNPCGKIGGLVKTGAGKGTTATIPVGGIAVDLRDAETQNVIAQTTTDANGTYEFIELGYGNYIVYPSENGFTTVPSSEVAITKTSLTAGNVNFVKNNSDKTIAPSSATGTPVIEAAANSLSVYPNPSNGDLNITWENQSIETANVIVTNVVGSEVYKGTLDMNTTSGQAHIDLKNLKSGIYLITIKSANVSYSSKLFIQQ